MFLRVLIISHLSGDLLLLSMPLIHHPIIYFPGPEVGSRESERSRRSLYSSDLVTSISHLKNEEPFYKQLRKENEDT